MSTTITVEDTTFGGRHRTFTSYPNQDSSFHTSTCCGQAAVYSGDRTKRGAEMETSFPAFVIRNPPDNFFGLLGTSGNKIRSMLRAYGHSGNTDTGGSALRRTLRSRPAIVCLDVGKIHPEKMGLHWVCVFGYGTDYYYMSNISTFRVTRRKFSDAWSAPLVWSLGLSRKFYII